MGNAFSGFCFVGGDGGASMTGIIHIAVARKPIEGTVAENCLFWHCGAINIDGCRIGTEDTRGKASLTALGVMNDDSWKAREVVAGSICGRFPANLILDTSDEVQKRFPDSVSTGGNNPIRRHKNGWKDGYFIEGVSTRASNTGGLGDSGSASRFFFNFSEQESDE